MANWQSRIDVKDVWRAAQAGELTAQEVGQKIAAKLKGLPPGLRDRDLHGIQQDFETLDEQDSFDDLDNILERLYDWADCGHRLWVGTF
jgi:hypothetical protein